MTADERSFLEAIWDDPHDDTARLVYADWLEESGRVTHADAIRRGVLKKPTRWTFGVGKPAVVSYTSERPESRGEVVSVKLAPGVDGVQWTVWKGTLERCQIAWARLLELTASATFTPPEVWLTDRPGVILADANLDTGRRWRLFGVPGRKTHRVKDGEDPALVVLRAEFPWVRRWNYPVPLTGALVVPQDDTIPDDIGDAVRFADGRKGVLASRIDPNGYALVDFNR